MSGERVERPREGGASAGAADHAFLAAVTARHARVVQTYGSGGLGELRLLADDVPRLVELAARGVLDRALIEQHAGHLARAEAVRALHGAFEMPGGLIVCIHCTSEFRFAEWPCLTLTALDGA